jgi:SAM-dependent methyltransferase
MPITTQEQSHPSENEPHKARQMAESFGADVERYDRARPRYPDALVERIVAASPGPDVLDVGCGTGIEARQFQAAGCTVLGVDPDARMAEFARRSGVEVEVATFEAWDPAGRSFDAVVAGQAWHWVDPVAGVVKAAQVLRPGGLLAVFAHAFAPPPAVAEAFATVYRRVVPDSPFQGQAPRQALDIYQTMFAKFSDGIREAGSGFSDPEQWRFDWEQSYTRDEWLDLLPTTGGLTRLPADKLAEVLAGVGTAIDEIGGRFTMTYTTLAVAAALTATPAQATAGSLTSQARGAGFGARRQPPAAAAHPDRADN